MRNGRSRSSEVIDFCTNRKRICNFLLVINSNFGPILFQFQIYCMFSVENSDPTPIPPEYWGCSLGLDCRCWDSEERRPWANYLRNYFRTNPTYMATVHQRHGRTDRQTDRQADRRLTIAIPRNAHSASRGNKSSWQPASLLNFSSRRLKIAVINHTIFDQKYEAMICWPGVSQTNTHSICLAFAQRRAVKIFRL